MEKVDDITPTWSALLELLLASGNSGKEQLKKMARIADTAIEYQKAVRNMVVLCYKITLLVKEDGLEKEQRCILKEIRFQLDGYVNSKSNHTCKDLGDGFCEKCARKL